MKLVLIPVITLTLEFLFLIQHVSTAPTTTAAEPIVELTQGKLKGRLAVSRNGKNFAQYKGIPYAAKPIRFQEAGPPEKWEGVKDGTRFGSPCVQFDRKTKGVIGTEDCLVLNVFTPVIPTPTSTGSSTTSTSANPGAATSKTSISSTTTASPALSSSLYSTRASRLPVLVYLHGGSFVSQSGQIFGAKYLMDENVILVTLNYRLGALGFLSTGDSDSIANLGLRDQILALKWIKENIEKFGGDPKRVTLIGGSAGGAMAHYLMLSPSAKGLFSRVISQSGNSLCPWVIVRSPGKIAQKLAGKLNCNAKTSKEIMTCFKGKSLKDLEIARVSLQGFAEDPAVPFAPVVEKWLTDKTKAVIPDTPQKLISEGKGGQIPWLTGYNSLNGLNLAVATILTTPKRLEQVDKEWNKLAPIIFHYSQTAPNPINVSEALRSYYFGNGKITEENKEKLVIALTDRNFVSCTADAALAQSKFGPVYLYTLNHQNAASFLDEWGVRDKIRMRGVVHNDELPYLFNFFGFQKFPELKKGDKETPFSEKMIKLWTEFARNGKPVEKQDKMEFEWAPVLPSQTSSTLRWYQLDSSTISQASPISSPTFKVWEGIDLGSEEGYLRSQQGKIVVGYTMTENPNVKPVTNKLLSHQAASTVKPPPGSYASAVSGLASASSSINKPTSAAAPLTPTSKATPAPVKAVASSVTPTPKGTSSTSTTTVAAPGPAIHAVFLDEDPYSSTTTTTTKKPGILSKIFG